MTEALNNNNKKQTTKSFCEVMEEDLERSQELVDGEGSCERLSHNITRHGYYIHELTQA